MLSGCLAYHECIGIGRNNAEWFHFFDRLESKQDGGGVYRVTIWFFAYIRDSEYAGCKETQWPVCEDLRTLGEQLGSEYGERFRKWFFSPDESTFGDDVIIMVNGRRAEFLNGIDTKLSDSDTILLFPVVAGG